MSRPRIFATVIAIALVLAAAPATNAATIEGTMQSSILGLVNGARADLGLRPLRADSRLGSLAVLRARWMAERRDLTHDSHGGSIDAAVTSTGIPWLSVGEDVARSSGPAGTAAAAVLFDAWRSSPPHWAAITSDTFNYIGVGVALASPGADPFAALVFVETEDRTAPVAAITAGRVSGQSVTWTWRGTEITLQTHTAGLCSFDVQYRVDTGPWRALRTGTRSTSLALSARPRGHTYSIRVRARDCAGNVSAFTAPKVMKVS